MRKVRRGAKGRRGFTLVELLVAMAVLVLMLVFLTQLLNGTTATIDVANRRMDTASAARAALDRLGDDFSNAILSGGPTALFYSEPGPEGNSALAFATRSRARGPTTSTAAWTTDTRAAFIGYKIRAMSQDVGGSATVTIPILARGDGRFTFAVSDAGNRSFYNLADAFGTKSARIPNDLTASSNDERVLNWQRMAGGVLRFHVSWMLDDGTLVQTPPSWSAAGATKFQALDGTGSCIPVAFTAADSADPNRRHAVGMVAGLAVLDEATRDLAYKVDANFGQSLGRQLGRPSASGETPVEVWNRNLEQVDFAPARKNIRFYQRFYTAPL